MTKAPNEIDRHVGSRVRMRRLLVGMSQEKLGDALGLTFQQVQKYEKGTNRISASRLQQIAIVLGVSIEYLYSGGKSDGAAAGFADAGAAGYESELMTSEGLKLLRAFRDIKDRKVRRRILDLVAVLSVSGGEEETEPERSP